MLHLNLWDKIHTCKWNLIVVYDPTQDKNKKTFYGSYMFSITIVKTLISLGETLTL
jgi:hypothetical protein